MDSGFVKQLSYNPRTRLDSLNVVLISRYMTVIFEKIIIVNCSSAYFYYSLCVIMIKKYSWIPFITHPGLKLFKGQEGLVEPHLASAFDCIQSKMACKLKLA